MHKLHHFVAMLAVASSVAFAEPVPVIDEAAAQMLARQSGCFKCHSIEKKKTGPPYRAVAAQYRGDPAAASKLYDHITTGKSVKFGDGHQEEHRIVQTTDVDSIRNLIAWILAL